MLIIETGIKKKKPNAAYCLRDQVLNRESDQKVKSEIPIGGGGGEWEGIAVI